MKTIGERLKKYRQRKNLSQKDVAVALHVPVTTYRDWEYGKAIRGEPYLKLASLFEVSLIELLAGEEPRLKNLKNAITELDRAVENIKKIVFSLE